MNRPLLRVLPAVLVMALACPATEAATAVPAPAPQQLTDPRANIIIGGLKLLLGRTTSSRVFKNVDELTKDVEERYNRYEQAAVASGNARVLQLVQEERKVLTEQLQAVRQNAYVKFRGPEKRLLLSTIANVGPIDKFFGQASTEIAALASKVNDVRSTIAQGGAVNTAAIGELAGRIERWSGLWSVLSGPSGRGLTTAAEATASSLRQVQSVGTAADAELATIQGDLTMLAQTLTAVKDVPRRPRRGGILGFIADLVGVNRGVIDVFREIFNPRLRNVPGMSRDQLERALERAVAEMMRRRMSNCTKRTGWELRQLLDNPDAGMTSVRITPERGPVDERLPMCNEPTTEQVVALADSVPEIKVRTGEEPVDRPSLGGVYTLTQDTTDIWATASLVSIDSGGLSVRESTATDFIVLSGETLAPIQLNLVVDLAAGTVKGSIHLEVACDPERCVSGATTTGDAGATFGTFSIGLAPTEVPAGFPFPEHHWYAPDPDDWYAGGPVTIDVALAGTDNRGVGGEYQASVPGWFQLELSPLGGYGAGQNPQGWSARFSLRLDYPDTENPRWDLSVWGDAEIWDPNVALPPEQG